MKKLEKMAVYGKELSRVEMRTIKAGRDSGKETIGGVCVSTRSCSSGCAVTSDGETGECSYCCYA